MAQPRSIRTDIEDNGKVDFLSRPLLRTNPKLTSNVKLIVAGDGLFLESFNADPKIAGVTYKKYRVKPEGEYAYDVPKFWNSSKTPVDLIYKVKRDYSDFSILDTYDKQVEETYSYGASTNYSKLYNERIKIFAPIWLDKNIPSKFVIYRISEAKPSTNYGNADNLTRINESLANATLIKTFDLSKDSDIGKYLRNHVNHEEFPSSPITMSFDKGEKTIYNGIDLTKGGFTSKGEFQFKDTVDTDKPLIEYNDFVTDGFFRNKVCSANLVNLEFMFDDDTSEEFTVNRYFGLFVDEHSIGTGIVNRVSDDRLIFADDSIEHELDVPNDWMALPYSNFFKEAPILGWVKSSENYHNVKNGRSWASDEYETKIDPNGSLPSKFLDKLNTGDTIDATINEVSDPDFLKIEVTGTPNNQDRLIVVNLKKQRFTIQSVNVGTVGIQQTITDDTGVVLTWTSQGSEELDLKDIQNQWPNTGTFDKYTPNVNEKNGEWILEATEKDVNMEESHGFTANNISGGNPLTTTLVKVKHTFKPIKVNASTFFADDTLQRGRTDGKRFSSQGAPNNIAFALSEVIKENTRFDVLLDDNIIYLKAAIRGYDRCDDVVFEGVQNAQFLDFGDSLDTQNRLDISASFLTQYNSYKFGGGSNKNQSLYIPIDDEDQFEVGNYLLDVKNIFNKIIDVVDDSRTINQDFKKIILERKNVGLSGVLGIYQNFRAEWGYFDAYDVYDLNFDFYDVENSNLKELYYEAMEHSGYQYSQWYPGSTTTPKKAYSDMESLETTEEEYFANLIPLLGSEKDDLKYDLANLGSTPPKKRNIIYSEFDRLEENNTTEFSTESRVVPYINKWCLKDSLNVRENPYYLNTSEVFGDTNFSPDFSKEERDPNGITHEWFYMDKVPGYFEDKKFLNSMFSYINPAPDIGALSTDFLDVNHDYFKSYFLSFGTWSGSLIKPQWGDTDIKKKYTYFESGDRQKFSETIFNGIKFNIKSRKKQKKEVTKEFVNTAEFNKYRFSTVLLTTFDSNFSNELVIKVIQNKKFKYVVMCLELNLADANFEFLNRKMLYELDHKLKQVGQNYEYADIALSGAISFSGIVLPSSNQGFTTLTAVPHSNGTLPQFTDQLLKDPDSGTFGNISVIIAGSEYKLEVANVINDFTIEVRGGLLDVSTGNYQPVGAFTNNQMLTAVYKYSGGGVFAHSALLNRLCVGNIAEVVNLTDNVQYTTVNEDGTTEDDKFVLSMDNGVEIIKKSQLTVNVDTEKPKAFGLSNKVIGYKIEKRKFEYYSMMNRHNGNYTVDMRPVITFRDSFSIHKTTPIDGDWNGELNHTTTSFDYSDLNEQLISEGLYKKLNYCRTQFNLGRIFHDPYCPSDRNFGVIKNHFFHKVNEIDTDGVIKLSELDALPPKYNLIGEIAIEKRDKNIFKSRWEDSFYTRSGGGGRNINVAGTKNIIEERSYVSSSVLKVGDAYDIYNFTSQRYKSLEVLNEVRLSGAPDTEISFFEDKDNITMDFDLSTSAVRELDYLGVRNTLEKYVEIEDSFGKVDTLDDDVEFYIRENILPLYVISKIDMWVKVQKKKPPVIGPNAFVKSKFQSSIDSVSSIGAVQTPGYNIDNSFTFKIDAKNPLNFRLIYNKKKGFNYLIRPLIKIQS